MDQSRGSDLCPDGSLMHGHKSPGDNNNEWSTAHDFLREKNHLVKLKADPQQKNKRSDKPRKRRQNITRRPGETDAQLKERRYQAKLKRNRESGVRARKRRQNEAGLLRTEHGQLLEQIHAKRLILRRLEQENAHLQQLLISERAANHPLFRNSGSPRKQGRRSQVCHFDCELNVSIKFIYQADFFCLRLVSTATAGTSADDVCCSVCRLTDVVSDIGVLIPVRRTRS